MPAVCRVVSMTKASDMKLILPRQPPRTAADADSAIRKMTPKASGALHGTTAFAEAGERGAVRDLQHRRSPCLGDKGPRIAPWRFSVWSRGASCPSNCRGSVAGDQPVAQRIKPQLFMSRLFS